MRAIAIVLARSSSKRIKNKNIIDFFNKPMLAYPIEAALNSKLFEKVFISSDSMEYVNLAKNYGASFLNLRPKNLADDRATTLEVMAYHMKELELKDEDIACCLYGASVFLQEKHLKNAFETLKKIRIMFSHALPLALRPIVLLALKTAFKWLLKNIQTHARKI